jgi:hypothetical protein
MLMTFLQQRECINIVNIPITFGLYNNVIPKKGEVPLQWYVPRSSNTITTKTTPQVRVLQNWRLQKKTVHKRHRRPIIDLRFSPWRNSSLSKQCLQQEHYQTQPIKARPWILTLKDKTLNFSCAAALTYPSLFQVTKHQANSTSPPTSDHHSCSTDLGLMTFSASTMERKRNPWY